MDKVTKVFNQLITKAEIRALQRAARILTVSDRHDALFFELCHSLMGAEGSKNLVAIGADYALVRTKKVAKESVAQIEVAG